MPQPWTGEKMIFKTSSLFTVTLVYSYKPVTFGCTSCYLGLFLKGCSTSRHFFVSTSSSQPSPDGKLKRSQFKNIKWPKGTRIMKGINICLLIGLQSTLRPPNRNKELSNTAVSVCHDLPTGGDDTGTLENTLARHCQTQTW